MSSRDDRVQMIRRLAAMRDEIDALLDLLLPEDEDESECAHPAEQVEDLSTMGEELYHCRVCNARASDPAFINRVEE